MEQQSFSNKKCKFPDESSLLNAKYNKNKRFTPRHCLVEFHDRCNEEKVLKVYRERKAILHTSIHMGRMNAFKILRGEASQW